MNTLSIDFGTSYCAAAYLDEEGNPRPVCFGYNNYNTPCYKIPTVIQYAIDNTGEESKIIGESALATLVQSHNSDSSIISKIKTELRVDTGYVINGKPKKSDEIVADIFGNIKQLAEKDAGRLFTDLVLTHPAQYLEIEKDLLSRSAKKCDFSKVTLLEEPKAAAYAFINQHNIPNEHSAIVFDYGGGTIDIAYLWIDKKGAIQFNIEPISKAKCGGEYIDLELHNYASSRLGYSGDNHIEPLLLHHCNHIKINFSRYDMQSLTLNNHVLHLTRDDFNKIISPKVSIALEKLTEMIQTCNDRNFKIDYIFLNGGSSRLSLIKESIRNYLPDAKQIDYGGDDLAVAIGALFYAKQSLIKSRQQDNGEQFEVRNDSLEKLRDEYSKVMV